MDQQQLASLPTKPGVYIFRNEGKRIIYIGKARNLKKRVSSYFANKSLEAKTLRLVAEARSIDHIVVASEIEAFLLESSLIKKYKPIYNIKLIDDKSFPYVEIVKNPVPYVVLSRTPHKGAIYLGPYTSTTDLKIVLRLLRRIFPYQSVKNHPNRRCLYNHIGLCPCVQVYPERLPEYKKNIRYLISFLRGNINSVLVGLRKQQADQVKNEEFEKAGELQSKINKITSITSDVYAPFRYEERPDFYFERINSELKSLQEILSKYDVSVGNLERIECYDISNTQGKNATGSMVVFTNGDANKSEYKRFKIKFKKTPDDFEMMREVLRRRSRRLDWGTPNLLVIDGGKGQITAVLQALAEQNYKVPVIGLAKREETIVIPLSTGVGIDFIEVKLPKSTPGINLLRRIRDEAHRFALSYHRLLRKKAFLS